jgi:FkbM family methyltransferase
MNREATAVCNGVRYHLDLRDNVQREMYFNVYEEGEIKAAVDLIPVGGTCLDVGANCGAFALPFAKKVGERGLVHAFEPDTYAFERLLLNCQLNRFESILKCHQIAVSNVIGSVFFYSSDPVHSGWGSVEEFKDIAVQKQRVEAVTLDHFLKTNHIGRVDFLKVDIEAHEPELLAGAEKALLNRVFRFVLIEFNGYRLGQRKKSLKDYLEPMSRAGYTLLRPAGPELQKIVIGTIPQEDVLTNLLFAAGC